jgi:hypothetical protein
MVYYGSLLLKNGFPTFVKGDALGAWNALNLEGSDILSEREMDFLDDMELDMLAAYVSATEAAEQLEAEKHKAQLGR